MRLSLRLFVLLMLAAVLLLPIGTVTASERSAPHAAILPPNFTDTLVASVASPTALAFTPDGRMLITTQPGRLRVYQNGALLATPALDFNSRSCFNSERGMLGVAVDPSFATNRFIYIFYTFKKNGVCESNTANSPVNRVSRFVLPDSNVIDPAGETVLVDNMPSPNGNHNAGDVAFGRDGFLYISIGDGGCDYAGNSGCAGANDAARDQHVLTGKVLRITRDGGIPPGNPFTGSDSSRCNVTGRTDPGRKCQETFAWGFRNPFRLAFDPNAAGTRFFVNDVGQNAWEEIDEAQAGVDYGWQCREGAHTNSTSGLCNPTPPNMRDPIHEYGRTTGCASITGGAFVPNGVWSSDYNGDYLFSDYVCGRIFRLEPNGSGGYTRTDFVTDLGGSSAVHLAFGPFNATQALYYTTYASGGQIHRVTFTGTTNRPPTAVIAANPTSGAAPLTVNFNGSGSSDPDPGNTLTYIWNFGDGSATRETTTATTSYTYNAVGTYTASLTVRDNLGASSSPVTIRIDVGNTPPTPAITAPAASKLYRVGETITLTGGATDAQDGTLPNSALSWRVILHHNTHTHPYFGPTTGNNLTFTAPAPEDLAATQTSFLEIELTATDSQGLSTVITQNIQPNKINVTLNTVPAGLRLDVNGSSVTGPTTVVSWEAYQLNVSAPTQTDSSGRTWEFQSWSDGGAAAHTITTPNAPASYTATFREVVGAGTGLTGEYFDNMNFTGTKVQRIDPTVNFNWGSGAPATGIGADTFSVRWTGQVQPQYSQTYTFYTTSDDGVRLWVNGVQVINNWTDHGPTENSGTIALTAGQKYAITMEFYENGGGATATLSWSSSSQPKQIIPQSRLFPQFFGRINFQPAAAPVPAGYQADSGLVFAARNNGYTYGWGADNTATARDRNNANSPDQRYDTLIHLQKVTYPNAVWEIAVPNGTYSVRIVSGDADNFDSVFRLNAEGTLAVNGTPTSATRWIEGTVTVTVSDGRLTIGNASGASNNKICFIDITGQ